MPSATYPATSRDRDEGGQQESVEYFPKGSGDTNVNRSLQQLLEGSLHGDPTPTLDAEGKAEDIPGDPVALAWVAPPIGRFAPRFRGFL